MAHLCLSGAILRSVCGYQKGACRYSSQNYRGGLPATKTRSLSNVVKQIDKLLETTSAAQEQARVETTANKDEELQYSVNDSMCG